MSSSATQVLYESLHNNGILQLCRLDRFGIVFQFLARERRLQHKVTSVWSSTDISFSFFGDMTTA
jgi:hypothetical protein